MFKFDGKPATDYVTKVLEVKRGMAAPSSPILQELHGKRGAYFFGVETGIMEFEIRVLISGTDFQDLWSKIRQANAWLKTPDLRKLELDDEPGLYYQAVCVDSLDLDEIFEHGFGTIHFVAPDPDAFGITDKQKVDSASAIFQRTGVRYREDGTQVTENYPYYKDGKFGQAALIEEGTTNLLTTASAPAQEEVSVTVGSDYYLSSLGKSLTTLPNKDFSVWLWNNSRVANDPDKVIDILKTYGFNNVYVSFNLSTVSADKYRYFNEKANSYGIKVHALAGDPRWGIDAYSSSAHTKIDDVIAFNSGCVNNGQKFAGVHLDIEPYLLKYSNGDPLDWGIVNDRAQIMHQWLSNSSSYVSKIRNAGLIAGNSIPFWLDTSTEVQEAVSQDSTLANYHQQMIDIWDYSAVMSYRDTVTGSNSIDSIIQNEINYPSTPKVIVSLETTQQSPGNITFYEEGWGAVVSAISQIESLYSSKSGYRGIAIHDYDQFEVMQNNRTTIEHKKTETLSKTTLAKEGTDSSVYVNTTWDTITNTSNNVLEVNDNMQIKQGTQVAVTLNTDAGWNSAQSLTNVGGVTNKLQINNLPSWSISDNMSSYTTNWTPFGDTGIFSQQSGYMLMQATTGVTQQTGIYREHGSTSQTMAMAFKAKVVGNNVKVWMSNSRYGLRVQLPDSGGVYKWYYIRRLSDTTGELYVDGVLQSSGLITNSTTTSTRMQFYLQNAGDTGTIEVDQVYFNTTSSNQVPPSNGIWTGERISNELNLDQLITVLSTSASSSTTVGNDQTVTLEFRKGTYSGGTTSWGSWLTFDATTLAAQFPKGTDAPNLRFQTRQTLTTKDPGSSPSVNSVSYTFNPGYAKSGYWEVYNTSWNQLQSAVKAGSTMYTDSRTVPANTTLNVYVANSFDNGTTYSSWTLLTPNGSIPGITQTTDLSQHRFKIRIEMSTTDVAVTPVLDWVKFEAFTGYKPSETVTLTGINVGNIGMAKTSLVDLPSVTGDASTSAIFQYSLDGTTWTNMTDNAAFITSTDLTGKTLTIRYTLSTTDTRYTPTIGNTLLWYIQQQEPNKIKPAATTIRVTPTGVSRWQLERKAYPTGWHANGTRNAEQMKLWIRNITDEWNTEGGISLWAYEDTITRAAYPTIFDTTGTTTRFRLSQNASSGSYSLEIGGQYPGIVQNQNTVGWKHFVITWDATKVYYYFNGSLHTTINRNQYPLNFTGMDYLWIGVNRDGVNHWNGFIDDVALYKRRITDAEVSSLYSSGQPASGADSDVVVYPFDNSLSALSDDVLRYNGTAPAYPKFTVEFASAQSSFKVSNGADYVLVNHSFVAGDVLEIDCAAETVKLNTALIMNDLTLDSDFFSIENGDQIIVVPDGAANVTIEFTERWV
jgi:predicted phage tail component-like protein